MFDKKLGYKIEKANDGPFIYVRLILCIGFIVYIYFINESFDMYIKHLFSAIGGVLILLQIYYNWFDKKLDEEIEKLKDEGYIVTGKIEKYIVKTRGRGLNKKYRYYLYVTFNDPYTNEKKEYITKEVNFHPLIELGSTTCTVYTRDDRIYVTDFVKRRRNEPCAWPDMQYEMQREIRKRILKVIILILMILFVTIPSLI